MAGQPIGPFRVQRHSQKRVQLENQAMIEQENSSDSSLEQELQAARLDTERTLVAAGLEGGSSSSFSVVGDSQRPSETSESAATSDSYAKLDASAVMGRSPLDGPDASLSIDCSVDRAPTAPTDQNLVAKVSGGLAQKGRQASTVALKKTQALGSAAAQQTQKIGAVAAQQTQKLGTVAAKQTQVLGTVAVRKTRAMGWKAFLWVFLLGSGVTGLAAMAWLLSLPPVPDCKQLQPLSPDADRLYCVEQAARSGKLEDVMTGLNLVKGWGEDHPMHGRAKGLMETWSNVVMGYAREKANKDDLDGAIAMAKQLPPNTPNHKEIQERIKRWEDFLKQGKVLDKAVQTALKKQDFGTAQAKIMELSLLESGYWQQRLTDLRRQMYEEMQAVRKLDEARKVVKQNPGTVAALGQALLLVKQVNPETYLRGTADKEAKGWEKAFVGIVTKYLAQSNWPGVEAAIQLFPGALSLPPEAKDALWLSRAIPLSQGKSLNLPMPQQIGQIWSIYPQVNEIAKSSGLRPQGQAVLPKLVTQVTDLNQLQLAEWVASLGPIPALQAAINLGDDVKADHAHHPQAKALVKKWKAEVELIEDRPYLLVARELGKTGKIPGLKAGIAAAQKIVKGRSLRLEGQSVVAEYTKKIQIIEDRPIIAKAQDLANQGRLGDAIREADKVKTGRALYWEAQGLIGQWIAQIQIAEDRPILNAAEGLASQGSLSAAIAEAGRIAPGRALYWEAQSAIGRWVVQRDAILRSRDLEPPRTDDGAPSGADRPMEPQPYDDRGAAPQNSYEEPSPAASEEPLPPPAEEPPPPTPSEVVPTEPLPAH